MANCSPVLFATELELKVLQISKGFMTEKYSHGKLNTLQNDVVNQLLRENTKHKNPVFTGILIVATLAGAS